MTSKWMEILLIERMVCITTGIIRFVFVISFYPFALKSHIYYYRCSFASHIECSFSKVKSHLQVYWMKIYVIPKNRHLKKIYRLMETVNNWDSKIGLKIKVIINMLHRDLGEVFQAIFFQCSSKISCILLIQIQVFN